MPGRHEPAGVPDGRALAITRVFGARPDLVFRAWTEPERMARWWGPNGFTTPFCRMDLRPGGVFHYCMRSPEGREFWGKGVYVEIAAPKRIVFTDRFSDRGGNPVEPADYGMSPDWPAETLTTVTFADHNGGTRVTVRQSVDATVAESSGAAQGWSESLDRLADYLAKA